MADGPRRLQPEPPPPPLGGSGLSSIPAPEAGWTWFHVPSEGVSVVTVVSQVAWFYAHWARIGAGRAKACCRCQFEAKGSCPMCDLGHERRLRYVLAIETDHGLRLVELGRPQYPALAAIESMSGMVGARLKLGREGRGKTSVIQVLAFGFDPSAARREEIIAGWVSNQGQREFLQWKRDRLKAEKAESDANGDDDVLPLRWG